MKRLSSILHTCALTLCAVAGLSLGSAASLTADAYTTDAADQSKIETTINYDNGSEKKESGAMDFTSLTEQEEQKIDSVDIAYDGESVLSVSVVNQASAAASDSDEDSSISLASDDETPTYFTVDFKVSEEENTTCFLAGLNEYNVEMVKDTVIDAAKRGLDKVAIEQIDFIDTEKNYVNDTELCWAVSGCNILEYTGWLGQTKNILTAADMLEEVMNCTADTPGNTPDLFGWFFNGVSVSEDRTWSANSGRYVNGYPYQNLIESYDVTGTKAFNTVIEEMRAGVGAEMDISFSSGGAHAVTLWGFVMDENEPDTSREHYTRIFITDSDDDIREEADRNYAPRKMAMYTLEPYDDSWDMVGYKADVKRVYTQVRSINTLKPYSPDIPKETDTAAMLDSSRYPNLAWDNISCSSVGEDIDDRQEIYQGQRLHIYAALNNIGAKMDPEDAPEFSYSIKVKDSDNKVVHEYTDTVKLEEVFEVGSQFISYDLEDKLAVGDYSLEFTVNEDHKLSESFYIDNSSTTYFSVVEAPYNITNMTIYAHVLEYGDTSVTVNYTYQNMDQLLDISDLTCKVYQLEYLPGEEGQEGSWSTWECVYGQGSKAAEDAGTANLEEAAADTEDSVLPYKIEAPKAKYIKYAFVFSSEEQDIRDLVVFSNVLSPSYTDYVLSKSKACSEEMSPVEYGDCKLVDGQQYAFNVEDQSTIERSEAVDLQVQITAELSEELNFDDVDEQDQSDSDSKQNPAIVLYEKNITLEADQSIITVTMNEWKEALPDMGSYIIKAQLLKDGEVISTMELPDLKIGEKSGTIVTTGESGDDESDGMTSLTEAVQYVLSGKSAGPITIAKDVDVIELEDVIDISGDVTVTIDGLKGRNTPVTISGDCSSIFALEEGSTLKLSNVKLANVQKGDAGSVGAIQINDSNVELENCMFRDCAAYQGAGIYISGGSLKAQNTSFVNMKASIGGAIYAHKQAKVDLLNCNILNGYTTQTGSAIYDHTKEGGYISIVNSSILGNRARDDGGASVDATERCSIVNSMILPSAYDNDMSYYSVNGQAQVYGCYISKPGNLVTVDALTVQNGSLAAVAYPKVTGYISLETFDSKSVIYALPRLKAAASKGCKVSLGEDSCLLLTDQSGQQSRTSVTAVFASSDYSKDMTGAARGSYYGSYAKTYTPPTPTTEKKVTKKSQTIKVTTKKKTLRYKKLKKKTLSFKMVAKAKTSLTYKKLRGNKKITITKSGKIKVKKGLKRGTYNIRVKITAKSTTTYKAVSKKVTLKVVVK